MADWFFRSNGKQGPVNDDTAFFLAKEGVIKAETAVWRQGLTPWLRADSAPGFPYDFSVRDDSPELPRTASIENFLGESIDLGSLVGKLQADVLILQQLNSDYEFRLSLLENRTDLPKTNILHPDFLTRAFAIWGHAIVPGLIIGMAVWLFVFLLVTVLPK